MYTCGITALLLSTLSYIIDILLKSCVYEMYFLQMIQNLMTLEKSHYRNFEANSLIK